MPCFVYWLQSFVVNLYGLSFFVFFVDGRRDPAIVQLSSTAHCDDRRPLHTAAGWTGSGGCTAMHCDEMHSNARPTQWEEQRSAQRCRVAVSGLSPSQSVCVCLAPRSLTRRRRLVLAQPSHFEPKPTLPQLVVLPSSPCRRRPSASTMASSCSASIWRPTRVSIAHAQRSESQQARHSAAGAGSAGGGD